MTRLRLLLPAALALLAAAPALAEDLTVTLADGTTRRYQNVAAQLARLRAATDLASKLELAKLLAAGIPASPGNPISKPDLGAANALLDQVIAGPDQSLRQQALSTRAIILQRSRIVGDVEKGQSIDAQLATEGYAPAIARIVNAGRALPAELTSDKAQAALGAAVLTGDSASTFALSTLLKTIDPARSASLASQALVFLTAEAGSGVSAASELGRRYLFGDGVPADPKRALEILSVAIKNGANAPLIVLNNAVQQKLPGIDVAEVKQLIVQALAAGSSRAAELIATDAMTTPVYGFTSADALYAVKLMADLGDRPSLMLAVKAYVRGLGGTPDLDKAVPYIEKLANVDGLEPNAILDLGDDLERLNLPMALELKYIEPIYRKITGPLHDEGVFRADRLLAEATQTGTLTTAKLGATRVTQIISELNDNAKRRHARSLVLLGDLYYAGIWVPVNNRQAMQYYQQSMAIEPSPVAQERLAKALMLTKATPFEDQQYRQLVTDLASTGSLWGQFRKAMLLIEDQASTPDKVTEGENVLLGLATQAYAPAVRALIKHLKGVNDEARIDQAITAFTSGWALNKDVRIGRLLGEFYALAGRVDEARKIFTDPIFSRDPAALLALAKLEASQTPRDEQRVFDLARTGITLAAADQPTQMDFVDVLRGLNLADAQQFAQATLQDLAKGDNTDAISALLPSYLDRIETDPAALATVLDWSRKLAADGTDGPILDLAMRYLQEGANPDVAKQVFAMANDAVAVLPSDSYLTVLVAEACYGGFGTVKDLKRGNTLIETAAAAGNKDALAELGLQYFYGMGRERNPDTALAVLDSAAALGSNLARVQIGRLYSSSTGPRVDMLKAYSSFLAAAENGSTAGMLEVGRLFLAGWGIATDEGEGVGWLQKAADLGNTDAMYQLYFHYLAKDTPADNDTAMTWLRKSAEAGVDPARLRLAERLLTDGQGANDAEVNQLLDDAFANGYNLARKFKRSMLTAGSLTDTPTEDDQP